ncbi:MAG: glycoside hydrolase family 65 protein [Clostridia bacterium]|nr:glycoside hydrolase family 65 protein [Clostridia bacterium]
MKKYTVTKWNEFSPKAYVSNGFTGFRIGKNPFRDVIAMLGGFTTVRDGGLVEALALIPAPKLTFSYKYKTVEPETRSQTYDFSCGEFTSVVSLDCNGETVEVTYTVFCSRTSPTLFIGSLSAKGDLSDVLRVTVEYEICDGWRETVSETKYHGSWGGQYDGKCQIFSFDRSTSAGVAFQLQGSCEDKICGETMCATATLDTREGKEMHIVTSYIPSVMHSEPHNQAHRMLGLVRWSGVDRIREQNRKAWAELWQSRITIDGAGEEWQNVIDASYFYLMTSASEFSPISVPPYGLSNPDAYEGHCFWDTESFMFMPPLFCAPRIARSMLDYRFKRMDAAANNARINGYMGIQFPWQSGQSGDEVTVPWAAQAGEQHINLDVALAFDGYARVHGDEAYIKEQVWPIIRGVCEWIESRVEKTERGYEILHITGIDEQTDDVNNDSYSNLMSQKLLRSGSEYSEIMGLGVRRNWLDIADGLYIPLRDSGVLEQYEGMIDRDDQATTTLMSYFPYGYTNGAESDGATFEYYITHGMERYCYYPMLSGFLGVFPAWLGDRKAALRFYEIANLTFFCEPFHSCIEWGIQNEDDRVNLKGPVGTNFITGRGSLLSGLIMGLTKICPWKGSVDAPVEEWLGEDIVLPEGWNKITVGRVTIRGKAYRIEAEHGAKRAKLIEL